MSPEPGPVPDPRDDARARILEQADRLLRHDGAAAVTTRAVASAAGVQPPTIYRLFGDKDGLVNALAEHVMAAYVDTKAAASASKGDPVADLRAGWRTHVEFGLANPELYRLLATHRSPGRSPATARGIEVLHVRVHALAVAGLLRVSEQRALAMIHAAGNGTVLALLEVPAGERDPGLADAMLDAVLASVLAHEPAAPEATRTTTVAVTFGTVLDDLPGLSDAERALMAEWLARSVERLQGA
jgi:AcrR family transcriptional regulator